jgi:Cd2+/Zn2+-exporting ATPase
VISLPEDSCAHCDGDCCDINIGTEDIDAGTTAEKGLFKIKFWYFIFAATVFLTFSLLFELVWDVDWASQLLALGSVLFSCHDVFKAAIGEIKQKRLGASTLMIVAAIGAFLILHGQEGAEAILLYSLADRFEDMSADRARLDVAKLLRLTPDVALLKTGKATTEVSVRSVQVGDVLVIKPGMKVPVDGTIVAGSSFFDTHAITGESMPKFRGVGDEIYASSINGDDLVELQVTRASKDTLLARITDLVQQAQENKSKTEQFIQKFARVYTPVIFAVAVAVMAIPWILTGGSPIPWIYRGLILLVISCPCALTLSTPMSMVFALMKLSREGILVKGGRYLEAMDGIRMFGFDKTATLTEGHLKVYDNVPFDGHVSRAENLQLIASLEANSIHPIAKAIMESASDVELLPVTDFHEIKGKGIQGKIDGEEYHVGSLQYFADLGVQGIPESIDAFTGAGKTPVLLSKDHTYLGLLTIRDNLRISAPILLRGLQHRHIKSMILSGDAQRTVDAIADCLYINERYGNLLPDQKLERIKKVQERGFKVSMVGDGINDAPALAQSNVGISMGATGTDIALESSDVTIMNDDLTKILTLLDIKSIANRIVKENIWVSILVKVVFAVLAVMGLMTLAIAVGVGDVGVSLLVIANGFRVFRYRSKFQDVSQEDLEVEATSIICRQCKTCMTYPQHHGREMVRYDNDLVCWKSLVAEMSSDACKEKLSLTCPYCNSQMEVE